MFDGRSWILESHVSELNFILQRDTEAAARSFVILNLGLSLNDLEDKRTHCLSSDEALHVGQGGYEANEAGDERNED